VVVAPPAPPVLPLVVVAVVVAPPAPPVLPLVVSTVPLHPSASSTETPTSITRKVRRPMGPSAQPASCDTETLPALSEHRKAPPPTYLATQAHVGFERQGPGMASQKSPSGLPSPKLSSWQSCVPTSHMRVLLQAKVPEPPVSELPLPEL